MNQIHSIRLYRHHGTWAFDDAPRGLQAEPFVAGIPAIIDQLTFISPTPLTPVLRFSASPFPGHVLVANRTTLESGGAWYNTPFGRGWLCPALLRYFSEPPRSIYVAVA